MATAQKQLDQLRAELKANPPATPALEAVAAAKVELLEFQAKRESKLSDNPFLRFSQQAVWTGFDPDKTHLQTAVKRAEMVAVAEASIAVPRWNELLNLAGQQLQAQQTEQAQLVAQSAQQKTLAVAAVGVGVLALFVLMELI
jgi:hypothetical protein